MTIGSTIACRPYALVFLATLLYLPCPTSAGSEKDPLAKLGYRATEGAAAGYVPDRACGTCHAALYESYQHVGMAKSFERPAETESIEDFGREFYHSPSQRFYQILRDGQELIFRRYQRDDAGKPINEFKTRIDWVMGSGNRARSYLYRTDWGEMYMLPLGLYSEDKAWGMSPGFENKNHPGVLRRVQRQCMFCHNAFPEVPKGSDLYGQPHLFPEELPRGTGCQRCHGPGADHIRTAVSGSSVEAIRDRIVNPRKLPPERRDSVCFQCHMLPSVAMNGARRFDRPDYSFRPGEPLTDYLVHVEIEDQLVTQADRFEINHHGYRMWQSKCFQESSGELACISCHDPHVKPTSKLFRAKVAGVCLGCHQDQAKDHINVKAADGDCVSCHMPTRRTRDVINVTMTDHRIARGPFDKKELVKRLKKQNPIITDVRLLPWGHPPTGNEAEIYRVATVLRSLSRGDVGRALNGMLARTEYTTPVPYFDLSETQIKLQDYASAEKTAKFLLQQEPDHFAIHARLGLARLGQNKGEAAMASLRKSLALKPTPEAHYNLALAAYKAHKDEMALEQLDAAIELSPNFFPAWLYKGRVYGAMGKLENARDALIRTLEIEPAHTVAYAELIRLLRRMGETKQADRYLAVGLRVAQNPAKLETLKKQE